MFSDMQFELTPYYTDSGVHHLVFQFQTSVIRLHDFDSSYERYTNDYKRGDKSIRFRYEKVTSEHSAPAGSPTPDG